MIECKCFRCGKVYGLSLDDFGEGDDTKSCLCPVCRGEVSTNSAQGVAGQGVNEKRC